MQPCLSTALQRICSIFKLFVCGFKTPFSSLFMHQQSERRALKPWTKTFDLLLPCKLPEYVQHLSCIQEPASWMSKGGNYLRIMRP